MSEYTWVLDDASVDWDELSNLYRIAPLGEKPPDALETVMGNSRYKCFAYDGEVLVGAGRVVADGLDAAYIADIAVHPDWQGRAWDKPPCGDSSTSPTATRRSSCTPIPAGRASTASSGSCP